MAEDYTNAPLKYNSDRPEAPKEQGAEDTGSLVSKGPFFTHLQDRGFIEVSGLDAESFLQNILTNDISKVSSEKAIYALLLTPHGKVLYDFFILEHESMYLLDCEKREVRSILIALNKYALNNEVEIKDVSDKCYSVVIYGENAAFTIDENPEIGMVRYMPFGTAYVDPRDYRMGIRTVCFSENFARYLEVTGIILMERSFYDYLRIWVAMPDIKYDLVEAACYPLDYNFDIINAIDFDKGCFIGQEVTARMKHKVKNRKKSFYSVNVMGKMPEFQSPVLVSGKKIGVFCSGIENIGMIHILTEQAKWVRTTNSILSTGNATLTIVEE